MISIDDDSIDGSTIEPTYIIHFVSHRITKDQYDVDYERLHFNENSETDEWVCKIACLVMQLFDDNTYEFTGDEIELFKPTFPLIPEPDELIFDQILTENEFINRQVEQLCIDLLNDNVFGFNNTCLKIARIMNNPLNQRYIKWFSEIVKYLLEQIKYSECLRNQTCALLTLLQIAKLPDGIELLIKHNGYDIIKRFIKSLPITSTIGTLESMSCCVHDDGNIFFVKNDEYIEYFKEHTDYEDIDHMYMKIYPMKFANEIIELFESFATTQWFKNTARGSWLNACVTLSTNS
jgi:hypothetical protein